tara:strand:+ start:3340 stop:3906 length:567 start_codon:yes stop_codon:yes gene_type:complete
MSIHALMFFDYGQPSAKQEAEAVAYFGELLGLPVVTVWLPLQSTALTGSDACVVPERNLIMCAYALHYATVNKLTKVYYGAIKEDHEQYVDCRPQWVNRLSALRKSPAPRNTKNNHQLTVEAELIAPIINMTKSNIIVDAMEYGIPIDRTWSCYNPTDGAQCGVCASCTLLQDAIKEAALRGLYRDCP